MRTLALFACAGLAAVALAQYPGAKKCPGQWRKGFDAIRENDIREHLGMIAGPDFRGRSPFSGDFELAAGYCAAELRREGWQPAGPNGSYFQRFKVLDTTVLAEQSRLRSFDGQVSVGFGDDFACSSSEEGKFEIRFAYLRTPKGSDLAKLDLSQAKGMVLVVDPAVFDNAPGQFTGLSRAAAAAGVREVVRPLKNRTAFRAQTIRHIEGLTDGDRGVLTGFRIFSDFALKLAQHDGARAFLDPNATAPSLEIGSASYDLTIKAAQVSHDTLNVLAIMPGADPAMKDQAVVVGAHLDHFGVMSSPTRPGADDNGSGSTTVLTLAHAIAANPIKPKRTVLLGLWSMEEEGLIGSWNYANHPSIPLDKTVAYINMDMLGRNEEGRDEKPENNTKAVYPGIAKLNSMDLYNLVVAQNAYVGLELREDKEDRTRRSDTWSFVRFGVPTLKAFTGEHSDYHKSGDTVDKINWTKLTNISKWLYLCVQELAARPDRPKFEVRPFVPPVKKPAAVPPPGSG